MAPMSDEGSPAAAAPDPGERLSLADWRRRMAELYVEVRALAHDDPRAAWDQWRTVREVLFREHAQSPVPAAERATFAAQHWPYDAGLRFELPVLAPDAMGEAGSPGLRGMAGLAGLGGVGGSIALPNSGSDVLSFQRIGWIELPLAGGGRRLAVYWMAGYSGGLFLPFRDATNGSATYGAGRYLLDTAKSADLGPGTVDGTIVVDLNFAFHPSCAFDPQWSCPLAPPENRLDVPVEAGERLR